MNLYTIGAITGKPNENRPEFERVKQELLRAGIRGVWTPFDVVDARCDKDEAALWEGCMRASLSWIIEHWDYWHEPPNFGIAMLDGWEESKGAKIEHDLAVALGIPCKPWREWL